MRDGVVYQQDQDSNVYALALATGQLKREYQVIDGIPAGRGPQGIARRKLRRRLRPHGVRLAISGGATAPSREL